MRLTPALAFVILLNDYVTSLTTLHNPQNTNLIHEQWITPCRNHWLSAILHIENYAHPRDMVNNN